jgi:hypothetical protein
MLALLRQVPEEYNRAQPYAPAAAVLYTSNDSASAAAIASTLFRQPNATSADAARAYAQLAAGAAVVRSAVLSIYRWMDRQTPHSCSHGAARNAQERLANRQTNRQPDSSMSKKSYRICVQARKVSFKTSCKGFSSV